MKRLEGKAALVTGGNSGIGLASAKRLHEEGARVVITGRSLKTLDAAVSAIGTGTLAIQSDVSKIDDIDRLFSTVASKLGKIDVLFANAGIAKFAPYAVSPETLFDELFAVNVKGVYFTLQKALPHLNDGASIIPTPAWSRPKAARTWGSMRPPRLPYVRSPGQPLRNCRVERFGSMQSLPDRSRRPFSGAAT
jgi:NAD(P)-dependent dehydrogenase (short-subunit alcohol dehydrogenase family)